MLYYFIPHMMFQEGGTKFSPLLCRSDRRPDLGIGQVVEQVERSGHARRPLAGHMRVDHGGLQALIAEQHLDRPQVDAALHQVHGETVAVDMAINRKAETDARPHRACCFCLQPCPPRG